MTDLVDLMFPPIHRKCAPEYTDFNYWRAPIAEYELPESLTRPPSPSLSASARSDTSTQTTLSRLRQFSLGRTIGSSSGSSPTSTSSLNSPSNGYHKSHVRSAASLDRLGSFIPVGNGIEYVTADGKRRGDPTIDAHLIPNEFFGDEVRQGRLRNNRPDGMPGSLDRSMGMQRFGHREMMESDGDDDDDDGEEEYGDETDEEYAEEAAEKAFDDDLLATGEMETVPFL